MHSKHPKVLHEVCGQSMLQRTLTAAASLEPTCVVTVVRYQAEEVAAAAAQALPEVRIAHQTDVPGTGSAAAAGLEVLPARFDGDVLITSADVPLLDGEALGTFIAQHRESGAAASVLTARVDDPTGYGRILRSPAGLISAIVEERDATDEQRAVREINSGTYLFQARALSEALARVGLENAQHERYLTDAVELLAEGGSPVAAVPVDDPWLVQGVNDRVQLTAVAQELNRRIVRHWQLAGVTVIDPERTRIDATAALGIDVTLLPGSRLAGTTVVQDGALIGPDTTLIDCEVGEGAEVVRTHATSSRIGAGAHVGPFSYLRPGTALGQDGKIGAFCETKNVSIGARTKLPHLSYAGDAEIGTDSNIGAGSIFANYDGVHKHRSTVGSFVRTGAHNVFVAPVHVGDGVYSGAGTVIRDDVPAGALAMNVAPQQNHEGWVAVHRAGTGSADAAQAAQNPEDESGSN
jgi:bifunctional UDP-N-acetylglucosamine pyrophosphorylase/glucosamine-1-phosphate N-acetyltransferase